MHSEHPKKEGTSKKSDSCDQKELEDTVPILTLEDDAVLTGEDAGTDPYDTD